MPVGFYKGPGQEDDEQRTSVVSSTNPQWRWPKTRNSQVLFFPSAFTPACPCTTVASSSWRTAEAARVTPRSSPDHPTSTPTLTPASENDLRPALHLATSHFLSQKTELDRVPVNTIPILSRRRIHDAILRPQKDPRESFNDRT